MDVDLKWLPGCLLPATTEQNHLVHWYLLQNIFKGCQQSLAFVLNAVLVTEAFHQGSHFPVVVPRHGGEQAAQWDEGELLQGLACSLFKTSPCPRWFPFFPPGWYSLMLDLEVQVPGEPVIEKGLLNVAGCCHLPGRERAVRVRDGSSQNQGEILLPWALGVQSLPWPGAARGVLILPQGLR